MARPIHRKTLSDYVTLAKALLVVASARTALHTLPFQTVSRIAAEGGLTRPSSPSGMEAAERDRVIRAVNAVSRRIMPGRRCLVRALSVQWFLRRAGEPAELRIGARKSAAGRLNAHAWVELHGEVIIGGKNSPTIYAPFQSDKTTMDAAFSSGSHSATNDELCRA